VLREITSETADAFIRDASFYWHQRFELAPGVFTPGANDISFLLEVAQLPESIDGLSVLDIGATNGGLAFELERRGAGRVVAVDIYSADWFGFEQLKELLDSDVEYVRASVYELPSKLDEQFDIVAFCGVLYHLRHPLLALDAVRTLTRGRALIETAIRDRFLGDAASLPLAHFHRLDDLNGDGSNWFEPSLAALSDWCRSSGLEPIKVQTWPADAPGRCMLTATPTTGDPEYMGMSYEMPLNCAVMPGHPLPGSDPAQRAGYEAFVRANKQAVAASEHRR
jgi:tRNA (mo5U34)-methyltransferase